MPGTGRGPQPSLIFKALHGWVFAGMSGTGKRDPKLPGAPEREGAQISITRETRRVGEGVPRLDRQRNSGRRV